MSRYISAALCHDCWDKAHPDRLAPRTHEGPEDRCHRCGRMTLSGIYYRFDTEAEPAAKPVDPLVTTARVESQGAHEIVFVWVEGKFTGQLVVGPGEGAALKALLTEPLPRGAEGSWEG